VSTIGPFRSARECDEARVVVPASKRPAGRSQMSVQPPSKLNASPAFVSGARNTCSDGWLRTRDRAGARQTARHSCAADRI